MVVTERLEIVARVDSQIAQQLGRDSQAVKKFGSESEAAFKRTERASTQVTSRLKVLRNAFGTLLALNFARQFQSRITSAFTDFVRTTSSAAATAEETANRFRVSFGRFAGEAEAQLRDFNEEVGRSETALKSAAAEFQAFLVPVGFTREQAAGLSVELTKLTIDLGSFFDRADSDVLRRLVSGLAGSREALDRLGITIRENELTQAAQALGIEKVNAQLTAQERALATLFEVFRRSADSQGDAARTADEFTNVMKRLSGQLRQVKEDIGLGINVALVDLINNAGGATAVIDDLEVAMRFAGGTAIAAARKVGVLADVLGLVEGDRAGAKAFAELSGERAVSAATAFALPGPLAESSVALELFIGPLKEALTLIRFLKPVSEEAAEAIGDLGDQIKRISIEFRAGAAAESLPKLLKELAEAAQDLAVGGGFEQQRVELDRETQARRDQADAIRDQVEAFRSLTLEEDLQLIDLELLINSIEKFTGEQINAAQAAELLAQAQNETAEATRLQERAFDDAETAARKFAREELKIIANQQVLVAGTREFGFGLSRALGDAASGTRKLGESFQELGQNIVGSLVEATTRILLFRQILAPLLAPAFGVGEGAFLSFFGINFKRGGTFEDGQVTNAQRGLTSGGGISQGTTVMPMVRFGEGGDEALLPLTRDSRNRLSVHTTGGGGGGLGNITININGGDAAGIEALFLDKGEELKGAIMEALLRDTAFRGAIQGDRN